jgi:hypothetical protein
MSAVLLFKMEVAALALHHLLLWNPTDFPISSLCSLLSCFLKTIGRAVFLVTLYLQIVTSTVQTGYNLGRFSGVRFPAFSTTESMTESLGFKDRSAGLARFRWSVLLIQTQSCPFQLRLITALSTAGDRSRTPVKFLLADDTILGWVLPSNPSVPPFATALLTAGFCSSICLKDFFADDARFRIDRPILEFFLL